LLYDFFPNCPLFDDVHVVFSEFKEQLAAAENYFGNVPKQDT